ncbi:MAG TPA: hypothetical protein VGD62_08355 [Acidobacteriaceae bacterium]
MSFAPSHFAAVLLFATFTSIVFGITQRTTPQGMVRYGLYCWVLFLGVTIGSSWLMYLVRH